MKRVVRIEEPSRSADAEAATSVWYGECQKNHAAAMGGYAVDGCREFMASAAEGTPGALVCAACSCHRNFHRRQVQPEPEVAMEECRSPSHSSTGYN